MGGLMRPDVGHQGTRKLVGGGGPGHQGTRKLVGGGGPGHQGTRKAGSRWWPGPGPPGNEKAGGGGGPGHQGTRKPVGGGGSSHQGTRKPVGGGGSSHQGTRKQVRGWWPGPVSRSGSSGGLLPSAGGDPCLVNAAAEVRTESRAPDVQRIRRHRDDAHGLDLGAGVQIEIPGLAAVEGAVDAADAGVEVATDGESSIGIQELNRPDGERRFKNAAAPALATIGGAVNPSANLR